MLRILGSAFHRELAHDSLCSRASLPRCSQARPCFWQETLSVTARSPWNLSQVALEAQPGSSRAWPGSASCCRVFAEGKASLARSASLDACPLALPFCLWPLVRASEAWNIFFGNVSFSLSSLVRPTDVGTELSTRVLKKTTTTGTTGSSQVPSSLPFFSKRASELVI